MDVDEIKQLDEHLINALLALLLVFIPELGHLIAALVQAVAGCPYHKHERDELTGELQAIRRPVEPLGEAGAIFRGLQYGSLCAVAG